MNEILSLSGFGVAFGERVILSSVDLDIHEREILVLMGPTGTGKSTLLRSLAGFNNANPSFRTWGSARYAGFALGETDRPALVAQSARLMMASVLENIVQDLPERRTLSQLQQRDLARRLLENAGLTELRAHLDAPVVRLPLVTQRHLAIMRLAATNPRLLCIDEPTTDLEDNEAHRLLDYIRELSTQSAILLVEHNQEYAGYTGGTTALLAGGAIQEIKRTDNFLGEPESSAARTFIRTGSCALPSPDADPEMLDPEVEPPPPIPEEAREYVSDTFGPRGFLWLKKGMLAGTPRPGNFLDVEYDLQALTRVGVTCLMTLTETPPETDLLASYGLQSIWYPIPDMDAPTTACAEDICRRIDTLLADGEVIALHCRAGLGRTGTMLASYLIWEGSTALSALERARRVEPRWVQSENQVAFLSEFERYCKENRTGHDYGRTNVAANQ